MNSAHGYSEGSDDEYYYLKGPSEFAAPVEKEAENLLVEMSVTLNNLCRFYDEKNNKGVKFIVDKAYELSHKGISHLTELDRLQEENARLRSLIEELIPIAEEAMDYALGAGWSSDGDIGVIKRAKEQFKKDNNL